MNIRVGMGYDVHRLVSERELWIGGVRIEHTMGLLGHSDADVLIHALCDALLGAASLRDIGYHFPDKDPEYKCIDSKILLRKVVSLLRENGYEFGNADMTVCAERPKLNPYVPEMQHVLGPGGRYLGIRCRFGIQSLKRIKIKKASPNGSPF